MRNYTVLISGAGMNYICNDLVPILSVFNNYKYYLYNISTQAVITISNSQFHIMFGNVQSCYVPNAYRASYIK